MTFSRTDSRGNAIGCWKGPRDAARGHLVGRRAEDVPTGDEDDPVVGVAAAGSRSRTGCSCSGAVRADPGRPVRPDPRPVRRRRARPRRRTARSAARSPACAPPPPCPVPTETVRESWQRWPRRASVESPVLARHGRLHREVETDVRTSRHIPFISLFQPRHVAVTLGWCQQPSPPHPPPGSRRCGAATPN